MGEALRKLSEEDPTFRVRSDENTGQTIISGMGELHLDIIVDRMLREFRVQANVGAPRVAYRESITRPCQGSQLSNTPNSPVDTVSMVMLSFPWSPVNAAAALSLKTKLSAVPFRKEYIPAVEKGVKEAAESGVLAGYPVVDLKVTLFDGSFHEVDSNEMAFKMAASWLSKKVCRKAHPILLEPMMKVEVVVPEEYLGDVMGQINSRRGIDPGHGSPPGQCTGCYAPWFRWPRCLGMQPNCARQHRDAVFSAWNLTTMRPSRSQWRKKF